MAPRLYYFCHQLNGIKITPNRDFKNEMSTTASIRPLGLTSIERLQSVQKAIEAGVAPHLADLRKAIAHVSFLP